MRGSIWGTFILATTCLVPLATAQAQEAEEGIAASDIVVTARRVEERLQDVPISITVYNQEQLASRNIINSTDLATYTPSLAANSRFGTEKASFAIRSFTQDLNTAPTVGVYFADVVAPRLASNITSGNGAGVGAMFDLQNVQVLKGPQGTLFGRNTTGGAILLVPNKPTDRFEGYVEGTYGNHDARRVQAVLNVPLADTFKVRAGVDRYVRDGYINNRSGIGPDKFNDINYWSVRLSIVAELTPNLENYTIFTWSKSDTNGMLGHMVACNDGTIPVFPGTSTPTTGFTSPTRARACAQLARERAAGFGYYDAENSTPDPFVVQRQWQVINTTTWRASDNLTVKNIASYAVSRERYAFNISGDNFSDVWVTTTFPGPNVGQDKRGNFTEELQLQGQTGRLTWQAGGYMERSEPLGGQFGSQQQYTAVYARCTDIYAFICNTPISPATSVSIANNVYTYRTHGLYAQATFDLTEQLAITAGIRNTWEYAHVDANNVRVIPSPSGPTTATCSRAVSPLRGVQLINNPVCTRSFTSKSNRPTWLVNLDYKPTDDWLIYAKWARGYRGGGVNEANFGIETWAPEKLDTYEVGLKASFRGAVSGNFSAAGFWNEFQDQQTSVFIPACTNAPTCAPTGINGIQNVGKSRIRGIEADGSLTVLRDLRVDFGYTYLDAKVTGGSVPFCDNTRFICAQAVFLGAGTRLLFAPKHRATVTGTYTLPLDESLGEVSLGATFVHTDKQFQSHTNDAAFAAGVLPENYGLLPATDLLNLNFSWKSIAGSPIDLALFATNVTNEKYRVATAGGLPSTGGEFILVGEPRMYGVRLKFRIGD